MKVAVIEDDEDKLKALCDYIDEHYDVEAIFTARSLKSGIRLVLNENFGFIFLDMTMKNFDKNLEDDGGRPHSFAGREILRQMRRERKDAAVVIVTHFDEFGFENEKMTIEELKDELSRKYQNYLGIVHFRHDVDKWKQDLAAVIGTKIPAKVQNA
ncbi:response regulator [Methylorubrum extorquens]|uniref:response regulator n=1 Tax=Methylorubrum extorquens TaxID=408 RepID=UPI001300F572|nr:response regulator [Methylorubrum extorquens]MCP1542938.1 response regulator of citrate/malate metabolism [Methylorubrum extorquens]MCP1589717.1 response regulator of citrate/malate metabolism [Methylorubrum extorquens]